MPPIDYGAIGLLVDLWQADAPRGPQKTRQATSIPPPWAHLHFYTCLSCLFALVILVWVAAVALWVL